MLTTDIFYDACNTFSKTEPMDAKKCIRRFKSDCAIASWDIRTQLAAHGNTRARESRSRCRQLVSSVQRQAANMREQRRMLNMKDAFRSLKDCLPELSYQKRLSRIETLRLAIEYIKFLENIVKEETTAEGTESLEKNHLSATVEDNVVED